MNKKLQRLYEAKEQLKGQLQQLKEHKFNKLVEPAIICETPRDLTKLVENFNAKFGCDFSYDAKNNEIIAVASQSLAEFSKLQDILVKKGVKAEISESNVVRSAKFSHLLESDFERAQVVLAATDVLDKLQKMAEDLAKMQADSIMPLTDQIKLAFGDEYSAKFSKVSKETLENAFNVVRDSKDQVGSIVANMHKIVDGEHVPASDMFADEGDEEEELDVDMGDDAEADDSEEEVEVDSIDDLLSDEGEDEAPLGRVKKESREPRRNLKKKK